MEGLTKYIRNPGGANTAEDARNRIRMWMHARRRAVVMKIPDLSPLEQMKALEKLIKEIEKKHGDFAHGVNQMKYAREGRTPTEDFVKQFQDLIEEELRLVEADEMVQKNRKKQGIDAEEVRVNVAGGVTGGQGAGGQAVNTTPENQTKRGICFNFQNTGHCRFGERCFYNHETQDNPKKDPGTAPPPPKQEGGSGTRQRWRSKQPCRYFAAGKCLMGDSCRWKHETTAPVQGVAAGIVVMTNSQQNNFNIPTIGEYWWTLEQTS